MRHFGKYFVVTVAVTMILLANTVSATFNPKTLLNTQTTRELSADENSPLHTEKSNNSSYSLLGKLDDQKSRKSFLDFGLFGASGEDAWLNGLRSYGDFVFDEDSMELVIGVNGAYLKNYNNLVDLVGRFGGKVVNTVSIKGEVIAIVVDAPLNAVSLLRKEVQSTGLARYVEPNMKFQAQFVPNDPYWSMQWGPQKIEADWAWNTTIGDKSILVAVIDTGIDYTHPDLAANYVPLGYDWVNNDNDTLDDFGHGTHCAGIIAAVLNNSVGIAGVAQVRIMAEKGLNAYGSGTEDDLANAIIHAVDQGANILSNSWGGYGESYLIHDAVQYAYNHSVLVIAAAGNEAWSKKSIPAGYEEVVAVTATDQYDAPAWFTNFGDWVEVAAPGVDVYSTMPTYHVTMNDYGFSMNYSYMSGTSMACPQAAAVAALIWSRFPNATRDWVRAQLRFTADDLGDSGFDKYYGYGRINARKAVEQVPPEHDVLIFESKRTRHIYPGYSAFFNISILNFGTNDEENVEVQLLVDDFLNDFKLIPKLANGSLTTVSLSWNPLVEGTYNVTLYIVPVSGETIIENNVFSEMITIRPIIGNVTFEEAHLPAYTIGDNPAADVSGGYGEFADYLASNGYLISTIDPRTVLNSSVLASVDVLVIVAPINNYSSSELTAIENWVKSGGKLLLISDWYYFGDQARTIAQRFRIILPGDGIADSDENVGYPYWPYYDDENLHVHPITTGVTRVEMYAGDGIISAPTGEIPLIVTDSDGTAYWYFSGTPANDVSVMSAFEGGVVGSGKLVLMTDTNIWDSVYDVDNDGDLDFYDSDNEILALNSINWLAVEYEHELAVTLKAPSYIQPGESTTLNATVYNWGLNNETGVQIQLFINSKLADSVTIPELINGTSYTLSYPWIPSDVGIYNVTAYVPPVSGENITVNNVNTRYVHIQYPLINPIEGQYANYIINYYDCSSGALIGTGYWNLTYGRYVEPYKINVTLWQKDLYGYIYTGWMIVNTMNRYVESGIWAGLWYPGWIETDINIGSTINLLYSTATVNGSRMILFGPRAVDCWEIPYSYMIPYVFWYDKKFGLWIRMNTTNPYVNQRAELLLIDTNVPIGTTYEHDLGVTLDAPQRLQPGETSLLNATVYNLGIENETDVEFQLLINNTVKRRILISNFTAGTYWIISESWMPTAEGIYNITAYAAPVSGEDVTINNVASIMVRVRFVQVALISSYSELTTITPILDSMGIAYDIYNDNNIYLYTEDLNLLLKYKAVILYNRYRWITSNEYSALESYLSSGGNLLVTGYDCLVSDTLLASLVRSSSTGDNTGEYDLIVVDETHPIVNGPYGSFPAGYHIYGLYSDCDRAEANTAQGAVTVAELLDTYDKIIATEGLPGKVVFWNGDGTYDWTWNSDCEAMLKNTIHWFLIRYQHELVVSLQTPKYLEPGHSATLNATVQNAGLNDETNVELQLLINGTIVKSETIPFLQNGTHYTINYLWTPTIAGKYNITVYAPPVQNENITRNNVYSKIIPVQYTPKILAYVQYTDYSQDYQNTIKAIESAFGPNYNLTELWDYTQLNSMLPGKDILLIPDQEYADFSILQMIGSAWATTLNDFLENGGIIILCDGDWGYGKTYGILTGAGLMSISGTNYGSYYTLYLVDPSDPLAEGVSQTFTSPYYTVSFITQETNVVVEDAWHYPVVIRKAVGRGQIVLLGFDFEYSNNNTERLLGNAVALTTYITISVNPSAGSPRTKVTVTGTRGSANGNVSIYWDGTLMANTTADDMGDFSYILTVPEDATIGVHEITAMDTATGRTASALFRVVIITLNPSKGPVGTKVTVKGAGFTPETKATITFNDMLIGYASVDAFGNFTFTFSVPLSTAESQIIKAFEAEGYASATFTVIDVTPLDVQIDVGVLHFKGEIAEFYSQIVFKGTAVNATKLTAILYGPNGETISYSYPENITLIATGLYKASYNIPITAGTGTYTLVITANYITDTIQACGTSVKSFLVSFTLEDIFLKVVAINGTTAVIQTTLGMMNGTITEIKDGIATIVVPGVGQIQTDISSLIGTQESWMIPQYLIVVFTLIAAASATFSVILLLRQRKTAKPETG